MFWAANQMQTSVWESIGFPMAPNGRWIFVFGDLTGGSNGKIWYGALKETLDRKNWKTVWQNSIIYFSYSRSPEPPDWTGAICRELCWQNQTIHRLFLMFGTPMPIVASALPEVHRMTGSSRAEGALSSSGRITVVDFCSVRILRLWLYWAPLPTR